MNLQQFIICPCIYTSRLKSAGIFLSLGLILLINVRSSAQSPDSWTQKADFPGAGRSGAVGFAVKGYGFIGTGEDSGRVLLKDFWRYEPSSNTWSQIADFAGDARKGAVAFGIDTLGFVGTGYNGTTLLKDFWVYNLSANSWAPIPDLGLPGSLVADGRRDATAIATTNSAYVICGYNASPGYLKENWYFDPDPASASTWLKRKNFANVSDLTYFGRRWCSGFSIDSTIYFGTGYNFSQDIKTDFWKYDPVADWWTQLADFGGGARSNTISFTLYGKGYIGCGTNQNYMNDFWRYDPNSNAWTRVSDYAGSAITNGISFAVLNRGYAGLGTDSLQNFHADFWEYTPDSTTGFSEEFSNKMIRITPNPATSFIRIDFPDGVTGSERNFFRLFDSSGKLKMMKEFSGSGIINSINFPAGVYYYSVSNSAGVFNKGKLVIL